MNNFRTTFFNKIETETMNNRFSEQCKQTEAPNQEQRIPQLRNTFVFDEQQFKLTFGKKNTKQAAATAKAGQENEEKKQVKDPRITEETAQGQVPVQGISVIGKRTFSQAIGQDVGVGGHCVDVPPQQPRQPPQPCTQAQDQCRQWREDEQHLFPQFKHFQAAAVGHAPPVPPRGGKHTLTYTSFNQSSILKKNEEADCFIFDQNGQAHQHKIERPPGQQTTHTDFSIYQIENMANAKDEAEQAIFPEGTSPTTAVGTGSNGSDEDIDPFHRHWHQHHHHHSPENVRKQQDDQYFGMKKRDQKACGKQGCQGCSIRFSKLKSKGFCHNCFLIYEAVEACVAFHNGKFEFVLAKPDQPQFELECARGHEWTVDFKTKEVKKWCRICKETDREQRRDDIRASEEQMWREAMRMQQELFQEAAQNPGAGIFDFTDDDFGFEERFDEGAAAPWGQHHQTQGQEFFVAILTAPAEQPIPTHFTQEQVADIVEFVVGQTDYQLVQFFEQVPRDGRMRAFRRIARIVHPDKCQHNFAKEAFQKLLRSSKSLSSNLGTSIYSYIIQILIKKYFASFGVFAAQQQQQHMFDQARRRVFVEKAYA